MKDNYERALTFVWREEGGVSDDARDPGGLTKYGVTQATLAIARGTDVSRADLLGLTRAEAAGIYRALYWNAIKGDDLPGGLDLAIFDFAVNSGPARAVKTVQTFLGVRVDGVMGPVTLAKITQADPAVFIDALHKARLAFLRSLSVWRFFGTGWSRRNDRVRKAALQWIAETSPTRTTERTGPMAKQTTNTNSNQLSETKSILQSRTVWANLIGLASFGLSLFGYGSLDVGGLTDAVLQTVTAGSFIASTVFRVTAKAKLG